MKFAAFAIAIVLAASVFSQQKPEAPRDIDLLWKKLESRVEEIAARLDGVMGVAILDLSDGRILLLNSDRVFPTASSIKIAILLELYRQDQDARAGAKAKQSWMTFTPSILKTSLKTARSWLVSLPASRGLRIATWRNSWSL